MQSSHFYDYLHRELLKRKFLMADETRIQVLHEKERKAETDSFMWLFRSGEDGLPEIILYKYTETRAKFNAAKFLEGFQGYLETDCYQGYNNLPGVRWCCCFAHLRRYFVEAVPKGKELDYSNPAAQGVQYINRLFEHERFSTAKKHTADQRYEYRLEKERPVLEAFWKWLSQQAPKKGPRLEKAVNYAQNHKDEFMTVPGYELYHVQGDSAKLASLFAETPTLEQFKAAAYANSSNPKTAKDSGYVGHVKQNFALPYGIGMVGVVKIR